MAEQPEATGTVPVTDRRPVPRGVLPRGVQTWLMVALAVGMLLIIFLTGQPAAPTTVWPAAAATQATDADRVRDYQERLRALDAQAALDARASEKSLPPSLDNTSRSSQPVDSLADERRRRDYESLFASNVVLSRRAERPDSGVATATGTTATPPSRPEPSIDDIADAVVRATSRTAGAAAVVPSAAGSPATPRPDPSPAALTAPRTTGPISAAGPLHRVLEGTLIETVLTNRLDGDAAAPVNCLVTTPLYSHSGLQILIPAGARLLGETKPVQAVGETRLAVVFHRVLMPDGSATTLDQFRGLNQIGDAGVRDRVNQHYWSTFGAAGAVGLVSGLAQLIGTAGVGGGGTDRTVVVAGSGADAATQATMQVINRFLNRLPTITIREGHRIRVYVTSDLDLPAWTPLNEAAGLEGR
jgi:type IV secretion system protein VirB10